MNKTLTIEFASVVTLSVSSGLLVFLSFSQALGSSAPPSPQLFGPQPPFPFLQPELSATQRSASTNQSCTMTPSLVEVEGMLQQMEGPYFVDDMPNRSDMRIDTSNRSVQEGTPLRLILRLHAPVKDAEVDIWHSNSQVVYSGVPEAGTSENDFLRGNKMTDDNGTVQFATIYPGWYEGRAIHIHVKVRTFEGSNEDLEWTSQFYLNNSINEIVHTQPPYSNHGPVDLTNEEDFIYTGPSTDGLIQNNTGKHLMLNLKDERDGCIGTFIIGLNATQSGEQ
jgi:protocatechuate 3,4-dioxygenase beta subunit